MLSFGQFSYAYVLPAQTYVDDVFSTYLYNGNGGTYNIVNGVDLSQGGLVIIKARDGNDPGNDAPTWMSYLPGNGSITYSEIFSNGTAAASSSSNPIDLVFNADGFTVGSWSCTNTSNRKYASWAFRKASKFFDVVTWAGNGQAGRGIPHSLGVAPGLVIVKCLNAARDWVVWHRSLSGSTYNLVLNTQQSESNFNLFGQAPTASTFYLGTVDNIEYFNNAGFNYVGYFFAHDASATGLVQCGRFTTDGSGKATVDLGWEPQFLLVKQVSSNASWMMIDCMRGFASNADNTTGPAQVLYPNTADSEVSAVHRATPTATGFRFEQNLTESYVYAAIRRPNKPPTLASQVFKAIMRYGSGTNSLKVTGIGFSPDWVLTTDRDAGVARDTWDRLRGGGRYLQTTVTDPEGETTAYGCQTFDMDGYTQGSSDSTIWNLSTHTFVDWCFRRAPGVFDIVCYTGTGVARTVTHGLGVAPELMIVKNRTSALSWAVYAAPSGNTNYAALNSNAPFGASNNVWNNTSPTASTFSVSASGYVNQNTSSHVAYLFASKDGISKVGSYTGNGTNRTIDCGFTSGAQFIMVKRSDDTGDWFVWDVARGIGNGNDPHLNLNAPNAEITTDNSVGSSPSGFVVNQNTTTNINVNGGTYIYLAIARPDPISARYWRVLALTPSYSDPYAGSAPYFHAIREWAFYECGEPSGTNICIGNTATASSNSLGVGPERANDNDAGTYWQTVDPHTTPQWWGIDAGTPKTVRSIRMVKYDYTAGFHARAYRLQASSNGTSWTDVATFSPNNVDMTEVFLNLQGFVASAPPPAACRYWRVVSYGPSTNSDGISMSEMQFVWDGIAHSLVGYTVMDPLVSRAYPAKLTDGITAANDISNYTYMSNSGGVFMADVDLATAIQVTDVKVMPQGDGPYHMPSNIHIYRSADGIEWTLCKSYTGLTSGDWPAYAYKTFSTT